MIPPKVKVATVLSLSMLSLLGGCAPSTTQSTQSNEPFTIEGSWKTPNNDWGVSFKNGLCRDTAFNMQMDYSYHGDELTLSSSVLSDIQATVKVIDPNTIRLQWLDTTRTVQRSDDLDGASYYDWYATARVDKPFREYRCIVGAVTNSTLTLYDDNTYELVLPSNTIYYGKYILNGTRLDLLSNRGKDLQTFLVYENGCATSKLDGYVARISEGVQDVLVGTCVDSNTGINYVFNKDMTAYQYIDGEEAVLEYQYSYNNGEVLLTSVNSKDSSYKLYHDNDSGEVYSKVYD